MPEPEAVAGFGQESGGARLAQDPGQVRDAAVEKVGQVGHGELNPQQAGRP